MGSRRDWREVPKESNRATGRALRIVVIYRSVYKYQYLNNQYGHTGGISALQLNHTGCYPCTSFFYNIVFLEVKYKKEAVICLLQLHTFQHSSLPLNMFTHISYVSSLVSPLKTSHLIPAFHAPLLTGFSLTLQLNCQSRDSLRL